MALKLRPLVQDSIPSRQYPIPGRAIARRQNFLIHADSRNVTLLSVKEQAMSRKLYSLSKQLVVATALALGTSGVALADDSSMNRFGGDSYAYFNQPVVRNAAASPNWRQSHPNGLSDHELQALSASGLSASAPEFNPPMFASAPAD